MLKIQIRDMVIVLPGITGSVLQKDSRPLWAISGRSIWDVVRTSGSSLEALQLNNDDPNVDDLGDGITATSVMDDFHLVPGLIKIVDGYTQLRKLIVERFEVIPGRLEDEKPANYFEFPYDWRRDNRVAARQLKALIDRKLPAWRTFSGAKDAKVLLIAHSMGGLICRYYLEVLNREDRGRENWRDCKALITFGTPYRGSVKALKCLTEPYKKLFVDLTGALRSFTSMYQLLPIYEAVKVGDEYKRARDVDGIPGIARERAAAGDSFYREIDDAVEARKGNADFQEHGYKIIPIVGTRQPTFQSAELANGRLTVTHALPKIVPSILWDGDGTVPRASATPLELSN